MPKFIHKLADILLTFYDELIAGIWAVLIITPVDSALYKFFTGTASYVITTKYWIFVGCYTTFFILSGACIPIIKKYRIYKTLNNLYKYKKINYIQKNKIIVIINDLISYKSLLSIDGALNFIMTNLFEFSIMFSWYGIEGFIANLMSNETLIVPTIYIALFFAFWFLQSFLDEYIAQQMLLKRTRKNHNKLRDISKELMTQMIEDLGGGMTCDKIGQILLERAIEDISDVITVTNVKQRISKKITHLLRNNKVN